MTLASHPFLRRAEELSRARNSPPTPSATEAKTASVEEMSPQASTKHTFNVGLKAEPDSVPQAEGVKLCEPTYAHPMGSFCTSGIFSGTSLSDSVSLSEITMTLDLPLSEPVVWVDLTLESDFDELANGEVRRRVAIIIYKMLQLCWTLLQLDQTFVCIKTRPPALFES